MKHCKRCSHPTICDTHGCAAEEARKNIARGSATDFDFEQHLARQRAFSERTFGPGMRTQGVVDHIRKELLEILAKPEDLSEWIDVAILALDGAWRTGATPAQIIQALVAKQDKNEARTWPDWRTAPADKAIEHMRTETLSACEHRNGHPEWDYWQCDDCGWVKPSGQIRGPHRHGYFPTLDCAKYWDKYRTYPGMEENITKQKGGAA